MKKSYYLFNPGRLSRQDNTLKFTPVNEEGIEGKPKYIPVEGVSDLYCFGSLDANSALYNFLGQQQISVHFFDYYEHYRGSFMPKEYLLAGKVQIEQTKVYLNKKRRQELAQKFIEGGSFNMLKNVRYYANRGKQLDDTPLILEAYREQITNTTVIDELMGLEGNIRQT
jgi:CRISPR-associated protein Cas1